ncbi:MAG: hypothetical protein JSV54_03960 [Chloroflexota bacterium]|nr:MAG: hypothetical protein JSV54_03960 [Chloroflexota bacterium]
MTWGTYAYTWTTGGLTIGIGEIIGDIATVNYQLLTLENGFATFNLVGISGGSYTLSVTEGTYALNSREPNEWEEGYTITPELYCEITQRSDCN